MCSPSPGVSTFGRWALTVSSPGRRSELPTPGSRPTSSRSSIHTRPKAVWPAQPRQKARTDSVDPPQVLSSRPAGRRVSDPLVEAARTTAVGCWPAGAYGAQAGRNSPGNRLYRWRRRRTDRLRPASSAGFVGLRLAIGEALSQDHPNPKTKLVDFRTPRRDPDHLPAREIVKGASPWP